MLTGDGSYDTDEQVKVLKSQYGEILLDRYIQFLMSDLSNFRKTCYCYSPGHSDAPAPKKRAKASEKPEQSDQVEDWCCGVASHCFTGQLERLRRTGA